MRRALVLCGLLFASPVFAYDPVPPQSFAKPTANGKFVLVMLHPFEGGAKKGLKEKYAQSGLYPADDPTKPVWTCDWKANWERNVFVSNDGIFAVRVPDGDPGLRTWLLMNDHKVPPKPSGWEDAPALFIYKNGKLFHTLTLREVFVTSRFTDRDCFMGPVIMIDAFLDAGGQVTIRGEANGNKQSATVAFRTGEVVERSGGGEPFGLFTSSSGSDSAGRSWGRVILLGLIVVGVCTASFIGAAVFLIRRERLKKA
jgi:hypothetical protein